MTIGTGAGTGAGTLKPIGVFKMVYILLLGFGLYGLGIRLASARPTYVDAMVGDGNVLVAQGVYVFMLGTAGLFIFAAYLSFEAFEHQQGPYADACMPQVVAWRFLELVLRFALVATLTVKLWQPENDNDLNVYVVVVSIALLVWALIVRSKYGARIEIYELLGNAALAGFSLILLVFSSNFDLASNFSLGAIIVVLLLSLGLGITGGLILAKVAKPFLREVGETRKKFFAETV